MSNNPNEHDSYYIPPNFIEGGTLFGGMFKFRNVIEAGILAVAVGAPVFMFELSLTVKIIILCLTALPAALLALIGISGESLSAFCHGIGLATLMTAFPWATRCLSVSFRSSGRASKIYPSRRILRVSPKTPTATISKNAVSRANMREKSPTSTKALFMSV